MVASPSTNYVSAEVYLDREIESPVKREYRDGLIYDMAGASNTHVIIAGASCNHDAGQWLFAPYGKDDTIHLTSIDFTGSVLDLYEDVDFQPDEDAANV